MSKKRAPRDVLTLYSQPHRYRQVRTHPSFNPVTSYKTNNFALGLIEDRRTYSPGLSPLARGVNMLTVGARPRLTLKQNPRYNQPSQTKAIVAFAEPDKIPLCIRRKERREVLHAKGVAGGKVRRPGRRTQWSDVKC